MQKTGSTKQKTTISVKRILLKRKKFINDLKRVKTFHTCLNFHFMTKFAKKNSFFIKTK